MTSMKVLLVGSYPPPIGGVTTHIKRLLEHSDRDPNIEMNLLDLKKLCVWDGGGKKRGLFQGLWIILLSNVVHIHITNEIKVAVAILFKLLFKKIVYTHHVRFVKRPLLFKVLIFLCDKVVLVNENLDRPVSSGKLVTIPAFLPPVKTSGLRGDVRKTVEAYSKVIAINAYSLTFIEEEEVYGIDLIVKACKILSEDCDFPKACIVFFDPSNAYDGYDFSLVENLDNPRFIRFCGEDLSYFDLLKFSDLSLRPTRTDGDALSVRESLAIGVPVIASDCTVRPDGSVLFNSGNEIHLAEMISKKIVSREKSLQKERESNFYADLFDVYASLF